MELRKVLRANEVDKAVSHIAVVFYIAGKVQEVIGVGEIVVNFLRKLLYRILVGNVANHHSCSGVGKDVIRPHRKNTALFVGGTLTESAVGVVWVAERTLLHIARHILKHING